MLKKILSSLNQQRISKRPIKNDTLFLLTLLSRFTKVSDKIKRQYKFVGSINNSVTLLARPIKN